MQKRTWNIRNILLVSLMVLALGVSAMAVTPAAPAAQAAATPAGAGTAAAGTAPGTATPTPGSTVVSVENGFTVTGDKAGYTYDQTNGVLTIQDSAVLKIANASSAATGHKIVVEKDANVNIILAGVNIDVSSVGDNCAFEIKADSTGSVTLTLADGTTNTLKSGENRAGLEKEGTLGSLTIRCAHSGESGHVCDAATCGTLAASSYNFSFKNYGQGAGIGSRSNSHNTVGNIKIKGGNIVASSNLGAGIGGGGIGVGSPEPVSNITISGGNVTASSYSGAGIGIGNSGSSDGSVSNITISGGNVTASSTNGAGIGSSSMGFYADITDIIISGGSAKISGGTTAIGYGRGTLVTPTDAKGTPVYLCKTAITAPATSVTVNGTTYGKHIYHDGSAWTTEDYAYIYLPNGFYQYGESGLLMNDHGTITPDPTPTATVMGGFTVWGDATGYDYDKDGGVLTITDGAVLKIANTSRAATGHKIVVEKKASADITLAGVNIDVSSTYNACAFLITMDSTGSVTLTLADKTENSLVSYATRAGIEKEGTAGNLTIRCAHSGESGHACDIATCGKLKACSLSNGAGIGSGYAKDSDSTDVANITIIGGNVYALSTFGAGIGSGYAEGESSYNSGAVSNITISGGNVYAYSANGAGIGSGRAGYGDSGAVSNITVSGGHVTALPNSANGIGSGSQTGGNSGDVSDIVISGGSVNVKGIGCQPTDGKGNEVYLYEIENADGKPVTINGVAYSPKHIYHNGTEWTSEDMLYPYLPGGSAQIITVGDTTSVKLYGSTGFVDAAVLLLDSTGAIKDGYATIQAAVNAAQDGYTVKLMDNAGLTATANIDKKLTLDLNGKTVSGGSFGPLIGVGSTGDLTVRDSATGGKISSGNYVTVAVGGKFTLESGTLEAGGDNALNISHNGTATLKGGTVGGYLTNSGTLYADGGEVNRGTWDSKNFGIITRHADATGTTKFYGMLTNDALSYDLHGTIEAGDFYGTVENKLGCTITGGTFHGTVTNRYWEAGPSIGIIKPATPGSIVINGDLTFEGGKNGDGTTIVDVTKEYLTNTLKLGGTGYVQVGNIRYVYGASGLSTAAASDCTIVLMQDVTINKTLAIGATVTLDLNGYTLKYESTSKGQVIAVGVDANFTLKDSSTARIGTVTGGRSSYDGGGVYNMGTFTMEGGKITGCSGDEGGGVYNAGTFLMKGGSISDCSATAGGGVYNTGDFTMKGGVISGCDVYSNNGMANDSSTGATIVYGGLQNEGSITGKLVKFMDGENLHAWEIVPDGGKVVKPADPEKTGYKFLGWYSGDRKFDFDTDTVTADLVLTAKWEQPDYVGTLQDAQRELQSSIDNLNSALAKKADADTINAAIAALESSVSDLTDLLDTKAAQADLEALSRTVSALSNALSALDAAKNNYVDADTQLKNELKKIIDDANKAQDLVIDELKTRLTKAEKDINDLNENKANVAYVNEKLEELNDIIDAVKQAYQDADDDLKEELLDYINRANDTQDGTIIALRYRLVEAEKNLAALTESKADATEVAEALGELNELIEAVKQAYKDADDELKEELQASIDSAVETLNKTIDGIEERLKTVETSVAELLESKADALDVSNALKELRESVAALEAVKEAYKGADEELKEELQASIDGAVETLNATIDGLKDRVKKAEQDIASLIENKADASEVKKALDELGAAIDALEAVKDNYASADEALKSELTQRITDAQSALQESIGKVSADLTAAQEALNKAVADGDKDLADKIAALNEQLELAKSAMNKADADNKTAIEAQISAAQSALSEAVDALSEELAALKTELTQKDDQLQTFTTVVCVIASVSLVAIAVFVIWFFLDRKKHI